MTYEEAIEKAKRAAIAELTFEMCGYILEKASGGFDFYQCDNIATDKRNEFEIDMLETEAAMSLGKISAVVHSHPNPNQLNHLSAFDRIAQYDNLDGDWILIKKDFTHEIFPPLARFRGRQYVANKVDCYTIIKDFFDFCGIRLPDFYREPDWWDKGKNFYLDNLPINGFSRIAKSEIKPGDVLTFCYAATVPNHAGIYLGDNKFLHHMTSRPSKVDVLDRFWLKFCHSAWRHDTLPAGLIGLTIDRIKGEKSNG